MNREVKIYLFLIFLHLFAEVSCIAQRLGCRDENGDMVDWFYLYKLPSSLEEGRKEKNSGLEYLYITPTSTSEWTLSERLISDAKSMPGLTLSPIYSKSGDKENLHMMYNDEPPNGKTDGSRGHTKGVVLANDISGFWLIHSVPKFPPAADEGSYDYPSTGKIYGQSFLCISFTGDQMGTVGKQLGFNEPHFYSSNVPEYLKT